MPKRDFISKRKLQQAVTKWTRMIEAQRQGASYLFVCHKGKRLRCSFVWYGSCSLYRNNAPEFNLGGVWEVSSRRYYLSRLEDTRMHGICSRDHSYCSIYGHCVQYEASVGCAWRSRRLWKRLEEKNKDNWFFVGHQSESISHVRTGKIVPTDATIFVQYLYIGLNLNVPVRL